MSDISTRFNAVSLRRALLAAMVALAGAVVALGDITPAEAFAFRGGGFHGGGFHGGFGGFRGGFGGFRGGFGFDHRFGFGGFHRGFGFHNRFGFNRRFRFGPRFAFGGPAFFPGYAYGYAGYDQCLRRVWGPYGWRYINVCY